MAMVVENQQPVAQLVVPEAPPPLPPPPQAYKHHCKVCKKGFVCGRALGGHMRAHGVNDDDDEEALDDDDAAGSCDDSTEAATTSNKRMSYALRDNPGRAKSCRVCENCGMEFTSWKSLLDHGRCRCNYDEEEDSVMIRSPPLRDTNDDDGEEVETDQALATAGWSKGKRTRRGNKLMEVAENGSETEATTTSHSREEEDLANCLVMLSSSSRSVQPPPAVLDADHESHAPATSKDVDVERNSRVVLVPQPISVMALDNMTMVPPELKLLAPPQVVVSVSSQPTAPRGLFECKACKKVFTSHQALGGHRASHKKVKGCYAAKLDSNQQPSVSSSAAAPNESIMANNNADGNPMNSADSSAAVVMATATAAIAPETTAATTQLDEPPAGSAPPVVKKKGKVHECSICHRVFMSGQALGGHKRCHWLTTGSAVDPTTTTTLQHHPVIPQDHHLMRAAVCQQLTLGRPPMFDAAAAHHPTAILDLNVATKTNTTKQQAAAELVNNDDGVLCLNAPAASLYMPQSWTTAHSNNNVNKTAATISSRNDATEDEADSRCAKKCKVIGDLKDMNVAGETSPWLQVGIGLPSQSNNKKSVQECPRDHQSTTTN